MNAVDQMRVQGWAMTLKIAQLGQPVLRQKAEKIPAEEIPTPQFQKFVDEMIETMEDANGVGLAGPQVFESRQIFLAAILPPENEGDFPGIEVFINPRIVKTSDDQVAAWEGCLSFPELQVLVPRYRQVRIEYTNRHGERKALLLKEFPARVIQHEYDHLEGVLTIDRAQSTHDIVKTSEIETVLEERKDYEVDPDEEA